MATLLADPPSDRLARRRAKTAFERNVLPSLTRWVLTEVERLKPDYLVPVETKGARLLEAIVAYAEEELGTSLGVPLVYATALAYMDPEELSQLKLVVFDDAVNTGTNLRRHSDRLRRYGAQDIHALAFIGHGDLGPGTPPLDCYQVVGTEMYHEYLWQLAELVVARGLPPEVDHQLFELRMPDRLPVAWERLRDALTHFGTLNIDGPRSRSHELHAMTLHFPEFPGATPFPTEGSIRNEGVNKVRFFADVAHDRVVVVPISFPTLDLDPGTPVDGPLENASSLVRGWTGCGDGAAEVLIDSVCTPDPEAVFRMLSACTEIDLMRGLARMLGATFPEGGVTVTALRTPFRKLYGEAGFTMAEHVDGELREGLEEGAGDETAFEGRGRTEPVFLTPAIADATRAVADDLRRLAAARSRPARPGRAMSEILEQMPDRDPLLASRCVGYGLATTLLVPSVQAVTRPDGTVTMGRVYRLSERDYAEEVPELQRCGSLDDRHQYMSEQAVALIATFVQLTVEDYCDAPVPLTLIAHLVAILHPLTLAEDDDVKLHVEPGERQPRVILDHGTRPITAQEASSRFYSVEPIAPVEPTEAEDDKSELGIKPTEAFKRLVGTGALPLEVCGSALQIESWLERLQPLIGLEDGERQRLLAPWAMCSDGWLGMRHVLWNLDEALHKLHAPLELVLREQYHEHSADPADQSHRLAVEARGKIDQLAESWTADVKERFGISLTRTRKLVRSLGAAEDAGAVWDLAVAVVDLTSALCGPVDRLHEISHESWTEGGEAAIPTAEVEQILRWCARIETVLTSMSGDEAPDVSAPAGHQGVYAAANALQGARMRVGAYAAALAGDYRGARGQRRPHDGLRTRTVLSLDMADSTLHGMLNPTVSTGEWRNNGLNVVAQWGRALSGSEGWIREGDLVWLEFDSQGDPAVMAAAITQEHLAALRSTGNADRAWAFRCAIDDGDLQGGDGGNTIAPCLDRASKLAKVLKDDEDSVTQVYVAPAAADRCSSAVADDLTEALDRPVALAEGEIATVRPRVVDTRAVIERIAKGLKGIAAEIEREMPAPLNREQLKTETVDADADADLGSGEESG